MSLINDEQAKKTGPSPYDNGPVQAWANAAD